MVLKDELLSEGHWLIVVTSLDLVMYWADGLGLIVVYQQNNLQKKHLYSCSCV